MFSNIGKHPLLGFSTLGGILGLMAYAKAILELHKMGVYDDGIVSTTDVAGFTARLALPFILLSLMFAAFVRALANLLTADHRRTLRFSFVIIVGMIALVIPYVLLYLWSDPLSLHSFLAPTILVLGFVSVSGYLGIRLLFAGQTPGVANDDSVQRNILMFLRWVATALGLLIVLIGIGLGLLFFTNAVSPLFWREAPEYSFSSSGAYPNEKASLATSPSRRRWSTSTRVLETVWGTPIATGPSIARFGDRWIFFPDSDSMPDRDPWRGWDKTRWTDIATAKVECIRRKFEAKEPTLVCHSPEKTPPPLPGEPIGQASLGGIATHILGCDPDALRATTAVLLTQFQQGRPRAGEETTAENGTMRRWLIKGSSLFLSGIPDVKALTPASDPQLRDFITNYEKGEMWILGVSSAPGSPTYNLDLSERRAVVTQIEIQSTLSTPDLRKNIKTYGLGEHSVADLTGRQGAAEHQVSVAFACKRA
jgi:hypothetical protein